MWKDLTFPSRLDEGFGWLNHRYNVTKLGNWKEVLFRTHGQQFSQLTSPKLHSLPSNFTVIRLIGKFTVTWPFVIALSFFGLFTSLHFTSLHFIPVHFIAHCCYSINFIIVHHLRITSMFLIISSLLIFPSIKLVRPNCPTPLTRLSQ
jgi:hypothetical protein